MKSEQNKFIIKSLGKKLNDILEKEFGEILIGSNIFGSLLSDKKNQYMKDLDMCLVLTGFPNSKLLFQVRKAYNLIVEEAKLRGIFSYHGPVVIFEKEPLLINSILANQINHGIFSYSKYVKNKFIINPDFNKDLHGELIFIIKEHLHMMRMSLLSLTENYNESQEEYVSRFHGIVALRGLLSLRGTSVPVGGYTMMKKYNPEIFEINKFDSYHDIIVWHKDYLARCQFHCELVIELTKLISTRFNKNIFKH